MAKVKPLPISGRTKAKRQPGYSCQQPPSGDLQSLLNRLTGCVELVNEIRAIERRATAEDIVEHLNNHGEGYTANAIYHYFVKGETY